MKGGRENWAGEVILRGFHVQVPILAVGTCGTNQGRDMAWKRREAWRDSF